MSVAYQFFSYTFTMAASDAFVVVARPFYEGGAAGACVNGCAVNAAEASEASQPAVHRGRVLMILNITTSCVGRRSERGGASLSM